MPNYAKDEKGRFILKSKSGDVTYCEHIVDVRELEEQGYTAITLDDGNKKEIERKISEAADEKTKKVFGKGRKDKDDEEE